MIYVKLVFGQPAYGRSFKVSGSNYSPGGGASGPGSAGQYTKDAGFLAYYEICDKVKNKAWKVVKDDAIGSVYAFKKGNVKQWVGYEDRETLLHRCKYINDEGLAGVMFWDTSLDDMKGLAPEFHCAKECKITLFRCIL